MKTTILLLTYGDYPQLFCRVLSSIRLFCDRSRYKLVVGANAPSETVLHILHDMYAHGFIDNLMLSEFNINKCPMMQRMLSVVDTEFVWWFDDDSFIFHEDALTLREAYAQVASPSNVGWGHVFYFSQRKDFDYGTDVGAFIKSASWYRGKELPDRWFFMTGGCWYARVSALRSLGWPDPFLVKRNDDVLLCEAFRQQGFTYSDIGPCGTVINAAPRRGVGEDQSTMKAQMERRRLSE